MRRKPDNWYHMTYEQQRAWEKAEREREDLEYERDRAREDAEAAQAAGQDRGQLAAAVVGGEGEKVGGHGGLRREAWPYWSTYPERAQTDEAVTEKKSAVRSRHRDPRVAPVGCPGPLA
jgi:hypothetical protein